MTFARRHACNYTHPHTHTHAETHNESVAYLDSYVRCACIVCVCVCSTSFISYMKCRQKCQEKREKTVPVASMTMHNSASIRHWKRDGKSLATNIFGTKNHRFNHISSGIENHERAERKGEKMCRMKSTIDLACLSTISAAKSLTICADFISLFYRSRALTRM